jgi:hypothetical protein
LYSSYPNLTNQRNIASRVSMALDTNTSTFEAKKGQLNLWTVRLPDELTREVREKLKAETKK